MRLGGHCLGTDFVTVGDASDWRAAGFVDPVRDRTYRGRCDGWGEECFL